MFCSVPERKRTKSQPQKRHSHHEYTCRNVCFEYSLLNLFFLEIMEAVSSKLRVTSIPEKTLFIPTRDLRTFSNKRVANKLTRLQSRCYHYETKKNGKGSFVKQLKTRMEINIMSSETQQLLKHFMQQRRSPVSVFHKVPQHQKSKSILFFQSRNNFSFSCAVFKVRFSVKI